MNFSLFVTLPLNPFKKLVENVSFFMKMFFQKKSICIGFFMGFFLYWGFWSNGASTLFSNIWGFFLISSLIAYVYSSLSLKLNLKLISVFSVIIWTHFSQIFFGFILNNITYLFAIKPLLDTLGLLLYLITLLFRYILFFIDLCNSDTIKIVFNTKITIFEFAFKNIFVHYWVHNYWTYLKIISNLVFFFESLKLIILPFFQLIFLIFRVIMFGWVNSEIVVYENLYNLLFEILGMSSYIWSFVKPAIYIVLFDLCYYIYLLSTLLAFIKVGFSIVLRLFLGFITWSIDWLVRFRYMIYPYESSYSIHLPKQKKKPKEED